MVTIIYTFASCHVFDFFTKMKHFALYCFHPEAHVTKNQKLLKIRYHITKQNDERTTNYNCFRNVYFIGQDL